MRYVFTSESVTKGHPDKVADQISDAILDALLEKDPMSRCACEVTVEKGSCHIMGEVTSKARIDYISVARNTIKEIGYIDPSLGFDYRNCNITCSIHEQSKDIAKGVDSSYDDSEQLGAGDQGMMFGYACNETENFMPLALSLARKLTNALTWERENTTDGASVLRPDGKAQVTIECDDYLSRSVRVDTVVVSTSHASNVDIESLRAYVKDKIILPNIPIELIDEDTKFLINPTGKFVNCGPAADTGLTGRKIIVDTYGGYAPHGGGAFSGKDATKVDRSGAYVARNIAKTIVSSGVADECEVQISYAIGVSNPTSVYINTLGSSTLTDEELTEWVKDNYDLRPSSIIKEFGLRSPIFKKTSSEGHFGNEEFPWEVVDKDRVISLLKLERNSYIF